jgi:DNA-binding response OmpR family regulator
LNTSELILIVEDEPRIADLLERGLLTAGYRTERASSGRRALELWRAARPQLILLDVMIPAPDGFEVLKTIRRESDIPILILSAKVEELDRLLGLEFGADDYIIKPFSPREVLLRVKTVLRRVAKRTPKERPRVQVADLSLDLESFVAHCGSTELQLTRTHFQLLAVLATRPGRVFSRLELLDGISINNLDERTIDTHIRNLRSRMGLCSDLLQTVRGIGYRLGSGGEK